MKKPLTPHQREVKRRRREDIPALYQGLSQDTQQSQDTQDDVSVIEFAKLPLTVTAPVWSEDAMDLDIASNINNSKSDENKSLNSQEDPEPITLDDEKELNKPVDSQVSKVIGKQFSFLVNNLLFFPHRILKSSKIHKATRPHQFFSHFSLKPGLTLSTCRWQGLETDKECCFHRLQSRSRKLKLSPSRTRPQSTRGRVCRRCAALDSRAELLRWSDLRPPKTLKLTPNRLMSVRRSW